MEIQERTESIVSLTPAAAAKIRDLMAGEEDVSVLRVAIEGGGHSWPGGDRLARFLDPPSSALDATDEIWRFFARH